MYNHNHKSYGLRFGTVDAFIIRTLLSSNPVALVVKPAAVRTLRISFFASSGWNKINFFEAKVEL